MLMVMEVESDGQVRLPVPSSWQDTQGLGHRGYRRTSLLSKTVSDLDQIYGKLPSKEDVTSSIDSALITGYALDIREYASRTAETVETYAPRLVTIEEYTERQGML